MSGKVVKDLEHCLGLRPAAKAVCCPKGSICCMLNCWRNAGRKLVHLRWTSLWQHGDLTVLTWLQVNRFELPNPNALECIARDRKLFVTEAQLLLQHWQKALKHAQAGQASYSTILQHLNDGNKRTPMAQR